MPTKTAWVYILASKPNGVLYTGVTSDLRQRIQQHKRHLIQGFTQRYNVTRLVWFRQGDSIAGAIEVEKKITGPTMETRADREIQPRLA